MKIPKGLAVGKEYFGGRGSDHGVPVTIPQGTFYVDDKIFPLVKDLWEKDIYTTECCDEGYLGIDTNRSGVTLAEVKEILDKHLPSFKWLKFGGEGKIYAVWDKFLELAEKNPETSKNFIEA